VNRVEPQAKPIDILLVEDNRMDIRLTQEALHEGKVANNLHVVMDGEKALSFLRREGEYADAPKPDIILLDLNLPRKDGRQVLAEVKADPVLRSIPVVVLTTSKAEEDIVKSYDLHVNCYITKPVDMQSFLDIIKSISHFWLTVVALPRDNHA
jgi:CheY-like chemotaxis protein